MRLGRLAQLAWPFLSVLTIVSGVSGLLVIAWAIEIDPHSESLLDVLPAVILFYLTPVFLPALIGSLIEMRVGRNLPIGGFAYSIGMAQTTVCALGVLEAVWCLIRYPKTELLLPASLIAIGAVGAWATFSQVAAMPRKHAKQTLRDENLARSQS